VRSTLAGWVLFTAPLRAEPAWQKVAEGVDYRAGWVQHKPDQLMHLLRLDPHRAELRHLSAPTPQFSRQYLRTSRALAVFNGGYFDAKGKPLGLLFAGQWVQPKVAGGSAFGGLFSLIGDRPALDPTYQISEEEYQSIRQAPDLRFLIQCGPRLLAQGQAVAGLEKTVTRRTAIAFDEQGRIVLMASAPHFLLSFAQLQDYLKNQLKVKWALNLDGGSSTQCSVAGKVDCPGFSPIPFALGVFARPLRRAGP
jgi:uncharacterized protein YigE (DUF2233 family)